MSPSQQSGRQLKTQPTGPRFGSSYDPSLFNPQPIGSLSQTTFNCANGGATVEGFPGLPDGNVMFALNLGRITFPAGTPKCQ